MLAHCLRVWRTPVALTIAAGVLLAAGGAAAQNPTGTVSGQANDITSLPLSGALVTAQSPSLQGSRTTETSENGDYLLPQLPPGSYIIVFEYPGFAPVRHGVEVRATESIRLNAELRPQGPSEEIVVRATSDAFVNTVQGATNIDHSQLRLLPTTRTVPAAVGLASGVHATGPSSQPTFSGGFAYENLYLLNGVGIQDNLRRNPFALYIEDAIQETTVANSGISAEYGRFSGGIVNVITRSGGNQLSGSFRTSFSNDDWRTVTPFGEPTLDKTEPTFEGTVGGPLARDRSWYFLAGRALSREAADETTFSRVPFVSTTSEQRYELKGTQAIGNAHRLQTTFTTVRRREANVPTDMVMDLRSLVTRELPQSLFTVNYTGAVSSNFFVEALFATRQFSFVDDGALTKDLIDGTVLQDQQTEARWWSPSFCGICSPEQRDSNQVVLKGTYFLSNASGAHDVTFGYDGFDDIRQGDNNQSGSDFHVWTTSSIISDGDVYPVITNDLNTWIIWWPVSQHSVGTSFRTHSLFVNDRWQPGRNWTFNLGLRYDKNDGRNGVNALVSNGSAWSPRLGVVWDPTGTGQWTMHAGAGRYVGAIANNIADSSSPAGIPSIYAYFYEGPEINVDPDTPLVPTRDALETVFDWYQANGGTDLPPFFTLLPGVDTQIRDSLDPPYADEWTVGTSRQIGRRGALRVDLVGREFHDFYAQRVDTTTGQVENANGELFDVRLLENTNAVSRRYMGVNVQADYRLGSRVRIGGNYSASRLWGTFDGENAATGPLTAGALEYPEFADPAWSAPEGDLSADQRHRARVWATVRLPLPVSMGGDVTVGLLQQAESGTPFGAVGSVRSAEYVDNPGYLLPPDTVRYFFSDRDAFRTEPMYRTDLAITQATPIPFARGEFFIEAHILNVFNAFQVFNRSAVNTTVLTAVDDPERYATFNPFTETPVEGVHWDRGERFGMPTSASAYTTPRTFRFSVGFRF